MYKFEALVRKYGALGIIPQFFATFFVLVVSSFIVGEAVAGKAASVDAALNFGPLGFVAAMVVLFVRLTWVGQR